MPAWILCVACTLNISVQGNINHHPCCTEMLSNKTHLERERKKNLVQASFTQLLLGFNQTRCCCWSSNEVLEGACFPRTCCAPVATFSCSWYLCTGVTHATSVFCFWTHWIEWEFFMSKICHRSYPSIPCAPRFAWVSRAPILGVNTWSIHFRRLIFLFIFYLWVGSYSEWPLWSYHWPYVISIPCEPVLASIMLSFFPFQFFLLFWSQFSLALHNIYSGLLLNNSKYLHAWTYVRPHGTHK